MKKLSLVLVSCLSCVLVLVSVSCTNSNAISSTPTDNSLGSTSIIPNNSSNATTLMLSDENTTYNFSGQNITLDATVQAANSSVNVGAVTFTVKDTSGNILGSPVTGNVTNGSASAIYALPGQTIPGEYNIDGSYKGVNFKSSNGTASLTVTKPATSTAVNSQTLTYSESGQNITLQATVSAAGSTINEGKVTFTIKDSHGNVVGNPVWGTVTNGGVSAAYSLPAGTGASTYSIDGDYSADNLENSNGITSLTVNKATTSIMISSNWTTGYAGSVTVTAAVTSDGGIVNDGKVTFSGGMAQDSKTLVGVVIDNTMAPPVSVAVSNGIATATFSASPNDPTYSTNYAPSVRSDYSGGDNFQSSIGVLNFIIK